MKSDKHEASPTKPKSNTLRAVLKQGDELIEVLELPDYGEVLLQMNAGQIAHVKETRTHKPVMPNTKV